MVAADQDLHGMLLHLAADAADLAFGHDVAVAEQNHLVGDAVHFVQDVAGDDDVHALFGQCAKQGDGFGAHQRIETVQAAHPAPGRWDRGRWPAPA